MHHWMNLCISWTSTGFMHHWMNLCISWTSTGFMHHGRNLCIVEWIYASTLTYLPALYLSSPILLVHVLLLLWVIDDLWMCRHRGWQSQMTYEHVMCCRWLVNASSQWVPDDLRMCRDGCRWLINTSHVVYCELFVAGFIYFVSWMAFEHVMMYCQRLVNPSSHWVPDDFWTCRGVCRWLINTSRVVYCELLVAGFIYLVSWMAFEHVMMYCQRLVNPSSHWVPDDLRMCRDGCRWLINTSRVVYCELFVAGFIYFVSWMAFEHVMMYCRRLMNPSSRWVSDDLWTCRDVCRCLINTSRVVFCVTYSSLDLVSLCLVDELWTYHAIVSSDYEYVMGCFLRDLFVERIVYSTLIIAFYWCVFKNYWLFLLQDLL